ncbi:MAG: hypothetical protein MI861_24625, partial [Pirellulales bacterium]|nr:hypothetical protein [Pirellulales bacterium]
SFQIAHRETCLRVPNAALRFFPEVEWVREEDKKIVTGISDQEEEDLVDEESALEKTTAANRKNRRHVWVWDQPLLRAVPVTIGIRDSKWTELIEGDLKLNDPLVTAKKQKR